MSAVLSILTPKPAKFTRVKQITEKSIKGKGNTISSNNFVHLSWHVSFWEKTGRTKKIIPQVIIYFKKYILSQMSIKYMRNHHIYIQWNTTQQ